MATTAEPVARVQVPARAGGAFDAYVARPQAPSDIAMVVLQEIFGVTRKIRAYCDLFARQGYLAAAPDLFWRQQRNVELGHSAEGVAQAMQHLQRLDTREALDDTGACLAWPMRRPRRPGAGRPGSWTG